METLTHHGTDFSRWSSVAKDGSQFSSNQSIQ